MSKNPIFDVPYLCVFYCGRSIMVGHNCGRAEGGASLALCMEMWVVSAPPCLLLWTHTTVTGTQPQPGTTQARGNGKRRWDGFSGGKVGRDGAKMVVFARNWGKIRTENWKDCVEKWVMWQFSEAAVVPSHLVLYIFTILQLLGITVFTHLLSIFLLVILYLWNSTFVYLWISVK